MTESLNVIALISGGKDSFYSMLHCIEIGHKIIALGNLHPPPTFTSKNDHLLDFDLNSFMYQTVGHTVIPLYEQALGIPLFRESIVGTALDTGTTYDEDPKDYDSCHAGKNHHHNNESSNDIIDKQLMEENDFSLMPDETESLARLLRRIMVEHPTANALCTGAIYSTYQRTRIESIASRLGLVSLSYLWQYPVLPPGIPESLLHDMKRVGLDARIIKVAGCELDESFLWQNVTSESTITRLQKVMARFAVEDKGTILGEGGEFETLVLDGPLHLFKGRIQVQDNDKVIVRESGGTAWLKILKATVVMKNNQISTIEEKKAVAPMAITRIPDLLDSKFRKIFEALNNADIQNNFFKSKRRQKSLVYCTQSPLQVVSRQMFHITTQWTIAVPTGLGIIENAQCIRDEINSRLDKIGLDFSKTISTVIILRSMQDFMSFNKVYSTIFTRPNPPARITVSCGENMPSNINILMFMTIMLLPPLSSALDTREKFRRKKGLHVQSRSYWAPANIGPYSQAITLNKTAVNGENEFQTAWIAGQIPLIPHTMQLPRPDRLSLHISLSLQHLWRIGVDLKVGWWTSVIAYLPFNRNSGTCSCEDEIAPEAVLMASQAWAYLHRSSASDEGVEDDSGEINLPDLWEDKYHAGRRSYCSRKNINQTECPLPDWSLVKICQEKIMEEIPPFFAIEIDELPRSSAIEWHTQLGIVAGIGQEIRLHHHHHHDHFEWDVHQCFFNQGHEMQVIISIPFKFTLKEGEEDENKTLYSDSSRLEKCLQRAQISLGWKLDDNSSNDNSALKNLKTRSLSYRDTSLLLPKENYHLASSFSISSDIIMDNIIPCYRIWDSFGRRLALIWIYNSI